MEHFALYFVGLNLAQENYHKENAALSKSSGKKADSGFKISAADSLDAADLLDAEVIDQAEVNDLDAISAAVCTSCLGSLFEPTIFADCYKNL